MTDDLLTRLLGPADPELGCEACFDELDRYVEVELAGDDAYAAGLLVAVAPRIGAFVVAAWLAGIIVNLLTKNAPQYYDIALRDFGLMLGALSLGRLAVAVQPARKRLRT